MPEGSPDTSPRMLLGIDTGGTFTDFVLHRGDRLERLKVPSTPADPAAAILAGIDALGLHEAVRAGRLRIVHGSTVATNATLEGKGVRTAYITNRGFTDMLRIGRQARTGLYSLHPAAPVDPVPRELCLGTGGRRSADGSVLEPLTGEDLAALRRAIERLKPEAIAINLLFSYRDDTDERTIEAALEDLAWISRSSFVLPEYKEYERGIATWLNAWLGPLIFRYLNRLASALAPSPVAVMQSSGGVIAAAQASRRAVNLLLSGPAGGLAAAAALGVETGLTDLMTFDMGGTSTDVCLLRGAPRQTDEGRVGPYPVAVPMADIHTIGAGGGSIAFVDAAGMLGVGPDSAGADPGPACYGRGGDRPTVTDANLVLGRLPDVPLGGTLRLDRSAAIAALGRLADALGGRVEDAATGVIALANAHMAQALRVISVERGHDPRQFSLLCYGGAGGLHVCALAAELGIPRIVVPTHAGVFSALGMLIARPSRLLLRTVNLPLEPGNRAGIEAALAELEVAASAELTEEGHDPSRLVIDRHLDLRYRGQSFTLSVAWAGITETATAFDALHEARYGHALGVPVEVVNVRVAASLPVAPLRWSLPARTKAMPVRRTVDVVGLGAVPMTERGDLGAGDPIEGPLIVTETDATTFVDEDWGGVVDGSGNLVLLRRNGSAT